MPRQQKQRHSPDRRAQSQQLRIIGGQWRGRKLAIADAPSLRPTG
ncbi:MAG: RsmD family RNA methyltransferase, partial [Pseudomonadota bacterium]